MSGDDNEDVVAFDVKHSFYVFSNLWQAQRLLEMYTHTANSTPELCNALLFATVVYYFRAFEPLRSQKLRRTGSIRHSGIAGFDRDVHTAFMSFRNSAVAHHDTKVHDFTVYFPYLESEEHASGTRRRAPMHPIFSTTMLYTMGPEFVGRAKTHLAALLQDRTNRLATVALQWYSLCWKAGAPSDTGPPILAGRVTIPETTIPAGGKAAFKISIDPATFRSRDPKLGSPLVHFEMLDFRASVIVERGAAKVFVEETMVPSTAKSSSTSPDRSG